MHATLRILMGATLGYIALIADVWLYGLLAVHSPFSLMWWARYPQLVSVSSAFLAALPLVLALGWVMSRLFARHTYYFALVAMLIAVAVAFSDAFLSPTGVLADLRETWPVFIPFLIGAPMVAMLMVNIRPARQ